MDETAAVFGASLEVPIGKLAILKPGIFYSLALDNQYEDELYTGFSLSFVLGE